MIATAAARNGVAYLIRLLLYDAWTEPNCAISDITICYGMMRKLRRVMIQPIFLRRKSMRRAFWSTIVSVCAVLLTVQAQQPQTVLQGVYAENQARRGQTIYKAQCALCHGEMLEGRLGPPLTGDEFVSDFAKQPLSELFGKIRNTMPQDNPGKLTPEETADILAYILQTGKFPAGRAELERT